MMTRRMVSVALLAGACLVGSGARDAVGGNDKGKGALCTPTCYEPEAPSPDAGKEVKACTHYTKGFCEAATLAGWGEPELNQGATFQEIVPNCKFPTPSSGKWAALSKRAVKQMEPKKGDVAFIAASDDWGMADVSDGTKERCLDLQWYSKDDTVQMSKCGHPDEKVVCEVTGSKTVRAINVIHYRIDEAKKLKATDKQACQQAALQAVAFSRGIPKFKKALGSDWAEGLTYKTRYDGVLTEAKAFAKIKKLGTEALALYKSCGGGSGATKEDEEMAFRQTSE